MDPKSSILVTEDRALHICKLGSRLDFRVIGAHIIYVGLEEDLTVCWDNEVCATARVIMVRPFQRHRVSAGRQFVKTILIEPESVDTQSLQKLAEKIYGLRPADPFMKVLLNPEPLKTHELKEPVSASDFDSDILGIPLPVKALDDRTRRAMEQFVSNPSEDIQLSDFAERFSISSSRFRRLFSGDVGVPFRSYRMWRRARAYLDRVMEDSSLTEVALDLGYPDSSHFAHSIRKTYGLPPREMRSHMRDSIEFNSTAKRAAYSDQTNFP